MPCRRLIVLITLAMPLRVVSQQPPVVLPERTVSVTRGADSLQQLGAAATVVDGPGVQRGRLGTGLDEALAFVPGVVVGNRWNYSLDQRLSVRGAGSRANFGLRGVKVLLDGVPQTLPDGQSQLTNLDLSLVTRIEVLRGAASSLEGNAAGGVISFSTSVVPDRLAEVRAGIEAGSFGTTRTQLQAAARTGSVGGTVAISRFVTNGFRLHSGAEQQRASLGVDWSVRPGMTVTLRAAAADDPRAENPGALTAAELAIRRDSASAGNILRGADKAVDQQQLAVGVRNVGGRVRWGVIAYGLRRSLHNPLATPPPGPATPAEGTFVRIDRRVGGVRADASFAASAAPAAPRVTLGIDLQEMHDERENRRSDGGTPGSSVFVDQVESVRELGPFAQINMPFGPDFSARAGVRHDWTRFGVQDQIVADGDASGSRTMAATSWHAALTWTPSRTMTAWTSWATSFETPTTTELVNRIEGDGGFNRTLDPQRSTSVEAGARIRTGRVRAELVGYRTSTRDALIGYRESAGRTYFRNAGRTRTHGAETGVTITATRRLLVLGTLTWTSAVFTDYQIVTGTTTADLAGNQLAGIPRTVARLGVRGRLTDALSIDVDHAWSSEMFADDANTIRVAGWGAGVTSARIGWGGGRVTPFAAVSNLFSREYVGSVTINGGFGRVFEPSAGRAIYAGVTISN